MALNKKRRADKGAEAVPIRPSAHEPKTSEKIVPAVLGFGLAAVTLFIISRVLIIAGIAFASSALMASSSAGAANIAGADLFNFTYITSLSTAIVVASVFSLPKLTKFFYRHIMKFSTSTTLKFTERRTAKEKKKSA